MNLIISWPAPSPLPGCGYKADYRRKADPSYTEAATSGTTLAIAVEAPASYEGNLITDCCSSTSSGTPFGINGYASLSVGVTIAVDPGVSGFHHWYLVTMTSTYSNPYDTIVSGNFHVNISGGVTVPFSLTYPADSTTSAQFVVYGTEPSANNVISAILVSSIAPIFNNGGQLQQVDAVNTPPYSKFYWSGNISGTTTDGAPSDLPSFTLDAFTATELSPDGTEVLAGTLNISYILQTVYSSIYNNMTIEVFDPVGTVLIGSVVVTTSPVGLRSTTISLSKSTSILSPATAFIMKTYLPDNTLLDTKTFNLPSS